MIRKLKNFAKVLIPDAVFTARKLRRHRKIKKKYGGMTGEDRKCNICKGSYQLFAPFHGFEDRMCPGCFSLERHRMLFHFLVGSTNIFRDKVSVLHFAPEKCLHDELLKAPGIRYETADLMNQFLPGIEAKPMHKMSITDIAFPDNTFDFFISNHVLEHVPDDQLAMREIYRVLKPGGTALLQVPIHPTATVTLEDPTFDRDQRRKHYGAQDHLRYYSKAGFVDALQDSGFSVEVLQPALDLDVELYRVNPHEFQFVGNKAAAHDQKD